MFGYTARNVQLNQHYRNINAIYGGNIKTKR